MPPWRNLSLNRLAVQICGSKKLRARNFESNNILSFVQKGVINVEKFTLAAKFDGFGPG